MLKPMKTKTGMPRNAFLWVLVALFTLSGIVALISAFGGDGNSGEDEVNAVYTNAAATLAAQQGAPASPTATMPGGGQIPTATATFLALPSPTLLSLPTLPSSTPGSGSGSGSGAVGCNNSVFVTDVTIPDDTVMTPGQAITKTWKLQNTGSCAWTPTYKVSFVSGNAMSGTTTPIGITVQPGSSGDVSVSLKAPATAGDAIGYWILTNDSNQNFGSTFYIKIKVGGTAATGTVTATATATATGGVSPSSTPAASATTAPTSTTAPSNTPEPTATSAP